MVLMLLCMHLKVDEDGGGGGEYEDDDFFVCTFWGLNVVDGENDDVLFFNFDFVFFPQKNKINKGNKWSYFFTSGRIINCVYKYLILWFLFFFLFC